MFSLDWREKHARGTLSALVSCILHTVVFIALALTYIASQAPEERVVVLQAALAGAEEVSLEFGEQVELEPPPAEELAAPGPVASTEFELNVETELSSVTQSADATLAAAFASVSKAGGSGGVGGGGGGAGDDLQKLGANFFGSYAAGERFVFVLDSSFSMTGDRWTYACQELLHSIGELKPNQKFFLICFDDKTTCMFNTPFSRAKYQENSSELRAKLKSWLLRRGRALGKGTYPAKAMKMALEMEPDAIFMLSDGELGDDTINVLRNVNGFSTDRRQVPIHTVHLMSFQGRESLRIIATENAGTFTPIMGGGSF